MTKQDIGKVLKKARGKITLYQIGKETGLTYQQLQYLEEGSKNYTIDSLLNLCEVLGLTITVK
jgi:transcriptional regulator with XRE-family HTH domain